MTKSYDYNVFLSWTGANRELKNQIKEHFENKFNDNKYCYDSDKECYGQFRGNYKEGISKSKVYLMILTDELVGNADSEVMNEVSIAKDYERQGDLNIIILCATQKLRFNGPYENPNDKVGEFYYTNTVGYSRMDVEFDQNKQLSAEDLERLEYLITNCINRRDSGNPILPKQIQYKVTQSSVSADNSFVGRSDEICQIKQAFDNGAQIVALYGIGGIGKTKLATEFARIYDQEEDKCRFLQVAHVQELQESNGLKLLVSSVRYEKDFSLQINNLPEFEKYQYKCEEIKKLPGYCLLVLDNFNKVDEDALKELVENLNCKLLITTRANLDENENQPKIKAIKVSSLEKEDAFAMFKERSGRDMSEMQFEDIWKLYNGHTLLLCVLAKMLKSHSLLYNDELVERLKAGTISDINVNVRFEHNDTSTNGDILSHLKSLYDIGELDEDSISVLRNMAFISDGLISRKNAFTFFKLENEDPIIKLTEQGWLENRSENDEDTLYIHPIISELIRNIVEITEENTQDVVDYLCYLYDNSKDELLITDATIMKDKLYHAIYRLAQIVKKLNVEIWNRFSDLARLLGDIDDLKEKTDNLSNYLTVSNDKVMVGSFYNLCNLEVNPEDIQVLEDQINTFEINSATYKWILKMMTIIAQGLVRHPNWRELLSKLSARILTVAIREEDDYAVLTCLTYIVKKHIKKFNIEKYIRMRENKNTPKGVLVYIKVLYYAILLSGDVLNVIEGLGDVISTGEAKSIKKWYQAPIIYLKLFKINNSINRLPNDDPIKPLLLSTTNIIDLEREKFNVAELVEAGLELLGILQQQDLTFVTPEQVIANSINIIKSLPNRMQGQLQQLVQIDYSVDKTHPSLMDISKLRMGSAIYGYLAENFPTSASLSPAKKSDLIKNLKILALNKSRDAFELESKIYSPKNYLYIDAYIRHANVCTSLGYNDEAVKYLKKAYDSLKGNPNRYSALLERVCQSILAQRNYRYTDLEWLIEVKNLAIKFATSKDNEINALSNYVYILRYINIDILRNRNYILRYTNLKLKELIKKLEEGIKDDQQHLDHEIDIKKMEQSINNVEKQLGIEIDMTLDKLMEPSIDIDKNEQSTGGYISRTLESVYIILNNDKLINEEQKDKFKNCFERLKKSKNERVCGPAYLSSLWMSIYNLSADDQDYKLKLANLYEQIIYYGLKYKTNNCNGLSTAAHSWFSYNIEQANKTDTPIWSFLCSMFKAKRTILKYNESLISIKDKKEISENDLLLKMDKIKNVNIVGNEFIAINGSKNKRRDRFFKLILDKIIKTL